MAVLIVLVGLLLLPLVIAGGLMAGMVIGFLAAGGFL